MLFSQIPSYYQTRLSKMGFDLYKLLTYFPEKLQIISSDLSTKADYYCLKGEVQIIEQNPKFTKFYLLIGGQEGSGDRIRVYDFGKKLKYLRPALILNENGRSSTRQTIEISIKQSGGDYYTLEELKYYDHTNPSSSKANTRTSFLPKYTNLSFQVRSKQINSIHFWLDKSQYLLNLEGLVPKSLGIPMTLDMAKIHRPSSMEEYKQTLYEWHKLQAFLDIAIVNYQETQKDGALGEGNRLAKIKNPELILSILSDFESSHGINLSNSQRSTIEGVFQNL
jgi:hypothetical protein